MVVQKPDVRTDLTRGPRLDPEYLFLSVEPKRRQSGTALDLSATGRVYCNIRALDCQKKTIWFQWQHGETHFVHEWKYRVPDQAAWRVFSEKRLGNRLGRWRVSVYHTSTEADNLLGHMQFVAR